MRPTRIIAAIVAFALIGLLPFTASSADASSAASSSSSKVKVTAKIVKRHGDLLMKGSVKPFKGPVIISKATKCNKKTAVCNFKKFKKAHVSRKDHKGHYQVKVTAPKHGDWYWQARVGSNKSTIWVTCTTVTGSCS